MIQLMYSLRYSCSKTVGWIALLLAAATACGGPEDTTTYDEQRQHGELDNADSVARRLQNAEAAPAGEVEELPLTEENLDAVSEACVTYPDSSNEPQPDQTAICGGEDPDPDPLQAKACTCVLIDEVNGYILRATIRCRGSQTCRDCCSAFWAHWY